MTSNIGSQELLSGDKNAVNNLLKKYFKPEFLNRIDDIIVFHAGTAMKDGVLVTNGGRVLNVCAVGKHLDETREKVYQAIEKIHFDGMYCRKDIGLH